MKKFKFPRLKFGRVIALAGLIVLLLPASLFSQSTSSTGAIQGTVTDPSGAVVPGAKVTITNRGNGQTIQLTSNSSGLYNAGALIPGEYQVRVEAQSFHTA
jgi:uncharacterized surface anchored protein